MLHSRPAQLLQGHSRSYQGRCSLPVLAKKRDPENKLKRRKRREWELNRDLEQHWTASTQKRDVWFDLDEKGFWVEHRRTSEEVQAFNARKASQRPLRKTRPSRQDLLKTSLEEFGLPPLPATAMRAQQSDSEWAGHMASDAWQQQEEVVKEEEEMQLGQHAVANAGSRSWDAEHNSASASPSKDDGSRAGASWQQQQQQLNQRQQQQQQQQRQEQEGSQSYRQQLSQQPTGGSRSLPPLPMDDNW